MSLTEGPIDSPTPFAAQHTDLYLADPDQGELWHGQHTLLLTTRGRKSGQARRTPLIYGRDGANYVLVASLGGAPKHPLWYLNLTEDPTVHLQIGTEHVDGRAATATGAERDRLWAEMAAVFPQYEEYQAKTDRQIPVVVVEPT